MKTIAIANNKGGCGKTTTTEHLGELLAGRGMRTLLVDLDPQANLSQRFRFTAGQPNFTIADALGGAAEPTVQLNEVVGHVGSAVDYTPLYLAQSEFHLANVAFGLLNDAVRGRTALRRALRCVAARYDLALIDCPPEAGILLVNALFAADAVLLPAEPEADALAGSRRVIEMVTHIRMEYETRKPVVLGTLAIRVDKRTNRHQGGLAAMAAVPGVPLWGIIPERNGELRDRELRLAYHPAATRLYAWLQGDDHA